MAGNRTLTIIKPDAFGSGKAGKIIAHLEAGGFRVVAARVTHLTEAEAGAFYDVHRERPFFRSLVSFMTSGHKMFLNQLLVQALKLRTVGNKVTTDSFNREKNLRSN